MRSGAPRSGSIKPFSIACRLNRGRNDMRTPSKQALSHSLGINIQKGFARLTSQAEAKNYAAERIATTQVKSGALLSQVKHRSEAVRAVSKRSQDSIRLNTCDHSSNRFVKLPWH